MKKFFLLPLLAAFAVQAQVPPPPPFAQAGSCPSGQYVSGTSSTATPFCAVPPGTGLTSVGLSAPAPFTVTGSPLTANGTLNLLWATNLSPNLVLASPTSGTGAPAMRALVPGDVPTLNQNTTGNAATATALAAAPAQCSGAQFSTGVAASGNANCATPPQGSVTSVSVTDSASALIAASVASPTTTPNLTLSLTLASANQIWAGPTSGVPATPTYRALVSADIPHNPQVEDARWFGQKADFSSDDSQPIINAIAALGGPGTVYVASNSKFNVTLTQSGVELVFVPSLPAATSQTATSGLYEDSFDGVNPALTIGNGTSQVNSIVIDGLNLNGNQASAKGLHILGAIQIRLNNLSINGYTHYGEQIDNTASQPATYIWHNGFNITQGTASGSAGFVANENGTTYTSAIYFDNGNFNSAPPASGSNCLVTVNGVAINEANVYNQLSPNAGICSTTVSGITGSIGNSQVRYDSGALGVVWTTDIASTATSVYGFQLFTGDYSWCTDCLIHFSDGVSTTAGAVTGSILNQGAQLVDPVVIGRACYQDGNATLVNQLQQCTNGVAGVLPEIYNVAGALHVDVTGSAASGLMQVDLPANGIFALRQDSANSYLELIRGAANIQAHIDTTSDLILQPAGGSASLFLNNGMGLVAQGIVQAEKAIYGANYLFWSQTAPTMGSGFCTGPTIPVNNGTGGFSVNVGTACAASVGTITLTGAHDYWGCSGQDDTSNASLALGVTTTSTVVTVTAYSRTTGLAANFNSGDLLKMTCSGM